MLLSNYQVINFEFRHDSLIAPNGKMVVTFTNIWDPADNVRKNKSLTIVNASGTTKSGYEYQTEFLNAVNALMPGTILAMLGYRAVMVAFPYHDEAPFSGVGVQYNENFCYGYGQLAVVSPHLTNMRNDNIAKAAEITALNAAVTAKQQQIDVLESSLLAAQNGGDSGAGAGSTVVTVQTPAAQDILKTGLAFIAGMGVGRASKKPDDEKPWTR